MKFNCFFLMPFLDDFPAYLRNELDTLYDGGVNELFDITEARQALQNTRMELVAECEANSKLQRRFDLINSQIREKNIEQNYDEVDEFVGVDDESTIIDNDFNALEAEEESEVIATNPKSSLKRKGGGMKKKSKKKISDEATGEESTDLNYSDMGSDNLEDI